MTRTSDFDVIVIGAGPAGASTTIASLKAGLRVAILERAAFPRFHVGESLHPGAEVLLRQLGVCDRILRDMPIRFDGIWVENGRSREFVPFGSDSRGRWRGFQVDRAAFDQILCTEAQERGAVVLQPCRTTGVRRDGRSMVIDCDRGELRARVVVDATGGSSSIFRHLGLGMITCSPRIVARYGYRESHDSSVSECPVFRRTDTGWQWTARVSPGVCQWITASWGTNRSGTDSVPERVRHLREIGATRGADVTWRLMRQPAGAGFITVGDAAAMVDPSSSHGVIRALASGIMAAHSISAHLKKHANEHLVTSFYNQWVYRCFRDDCRRLRNNYNGVHRVNTRRMTGMRV